MAISNKRIPLRAIGSGQGVPEHAIMPDAREGLETEVYNALLAGLYAREDRQVIGRDYREAVDRYLSVSASAAVKAAWRAHRDEVERITRKQIAEASGPDMARVQALLRAQRERLRKQVTDSAREHLREVLQAARYELVRTVDKRTQAIRRKIRITQVTVGVALLVSAVTWLGRIGMGHHEG